MIVLDPVDSTSAAGMVTRAQQADIPVISYDRLILNADLAAYAEFNSPEVGKQQGERSTKKLAEDGNPTGPIIQINGDPKDNNAKLFKEGATSVFQAKGVDVAKEYDTPDWLPENAQKEMDQAITAVGEAGSTASSPPTTAPPAARSRRSRAPASTRRRSRSPVRTPSWPRSSGSSPASST